MLPNDEQNRSWTEIQLPKDHSKEQRVIGSLITLDTQDDSISILGNVFIIRAQDDTAICIGASHSFEKAKYIQESRKAIGNNLIAPDFRFKGPEYIDTSKIKAFFLIDGKPIVCDVGQLNYVANYDVAVFSVHAPEEQKIFRWQSAVDLSVPIIGEQVAIFANNIAVLSSANRMSQISQRLSYRIGVITQVEMGFGQMPGQSFYFQTTIPMTAGMSGAPVIRKPRPGQPMIVRGVVSSDFSPNEAFSSFWVPGSSTASMIWPAMGLALHCTVTSQDGRHMFLGEMVDRKIINDRSEGVSVKVRQHGEQTQILYIDDRGPETSKFLLNMPPHPHIDTSGS
jgi:hypothetical protein